MGWEVGESCLGILKEGHDVFVCMVYVGDVGGDVRSEGKIIKVNKVQSQSPASASQYIHEILNEEKQSA